MKGVKGIGWHDLRCPKCCGRLHKRWWNGKWFCPTCAGKKMAEEVVRKVRRSAS